MANKLDGAIPRRDMTIEEDSTTQAANSRCPDSAGYLKFFEAGWRRAYQKRERFDSFSDAFDFSKCWERCQRCKSLQDNTEN